MFHPRRTLRALLIPPAAGLALTALPAQTASAASTLTNGGFESDGTGTATPAGWSTYSAAGQNSASFTEAGGHGGSYRLTLYADGLRPEDVVTISGDLARGRLDGSDSMTLKLAPAGGAAVIFKRTR